jgi:pyruvate/2-oxoglutarate dehydrogenase complex dihydrolipoamide dehydrogenase (E3) component
VPPIPGLKEAGFHTSDTVWGLTELPKRLVVLGGGPIGSELAQSFARLGSAVTQVEMAPRIMVREDPEVSELVAASLRADGVQLLTGHQAVRVEVVAWGEKRLMAKHQGAEVVIPFDELLCAVGRSPRVTGYGLEELGIPLTPRKTIETNAYLQTLYPNIYAVGDVAGPFQFTHTAAHQAWYAAVNALFGRFRRFKADYRVIPWATFTDPEVARVGLSESEAKEQGVAYEVTTLRPRRPRPRHCRRHRARLRQGAHRAGQGQDPGRDHRRRTRRRPAGRIRAGHEARPGPEQDPRHHPHLPDAGRGQQVRRR